MTPRDESRRARTFIDLSHAIEHDMITGRNLPAPLICDFFARADAPAVYGEGAEFHIARIDMVVNTGTYLDAPSHAFAHGADIGALAIERVADLRAVVVRWPYAAERLVDAHAFRTLDAHAVRGAAVLVHTGWDIHWRTPEYQLGHPALTTAAAEWLRDAGAVLVGIDSHNIDDTSRDRTGYRPRPVHQTLLGAGVLICEHLTNLASVPDAGARFSAVPPRVCGVGTWPVRAYAAVPSRIA